MRRLFVLLVLAAVLIFATTAAAQGPQGLAAARLREIAGSGIRATTLFLDSGSSANGLVVSGRASGLNPASAYVSLIYDAESVPSGPLACEPSPDPDVPLTEAQMLVGPWQVNADGTGSLFATKTGPSYAPLALFRTISIRLVEGLVLQACGLVQRVGP